MMTARLTISGMAKGIRRLSSSMGAAVVTKQVGSTASRGLAARATMTSPVSSSTWLPGTTNTVAPTTKRSFSSSTTSVVDNLVSVIGREIEEEVEGGNGEVPENLVNLKTQLEADWRIVDGLMSGADNTAITRMYKKENLANGSKVMVEFHCQDTEMMDHDDDEEEDLQEGEEEPAPAVRFAVVIRKAGKSMVVTCLTEEAEIVVESMKMKSDSTGSGSALNFTSEDKTGYQGPVVSELAEDVQQSLMDFLQSSPADGDGDGDSNGGCGISSDVAAFISMYADHKEQTQYMEWLKSVQSMVQ
jgi:complement component 1 Q subcomponent-binding protein